MNQEEISKNSMPVPRRNRMKKILLSILILLSGMVIGSGLTIYFAVTQMFNAVHHPENIPQKITSRMQRALDMNHDQTEKILELLSKRQKSIQGLRFEFIPRLNTELDELEMEIKTVLSPSQFEKWSRRFHRLRKMWIEPLSMPQKRLQPNEQSKP